MRTLRSQLILSHILPLLLITPLVAIALIYLLETQVLLKELSDAVTERANLIAQAIQERSDLWDNPEQAEAFIADLTVTVEGRIFLLGPGGEVLVEGGDLRGQRIPLEGIDAALRGQSSVIVTYGLLQQRAEVLLPVTDASQVVLGFVGVTDTLEGAATQFARLRWLILGVLAVALLLGVLAGLVLARRLAHPIDRAAGAVVDISQGHLIEPLAPDGPLEIQELSGAVNVLSERLRVLEEARRHSLANIVHELGRPLGSIRSAIHVLRQGAGDDPMIREELLAGAEGQIERMEPLLDDLAQLHGQVSGQIILELQSVPFSQWLPPTLLPWRAAAQDKGLSWQADIPRDLPTLDMDPERMAQVLGNLLSNAIKYTPGGGSVSVTAGTDGQEAWIRIADTGPGIQPDEQTHVFEPFYRGQQAQRFPQGLGLGLTIAHDLVEAHGGRLELDSTPGKGSRFTVHLPG